MDVNLITPEETDNFKNVVSVFLPGATGELEILPGHVPYVVLLKKGKIEIKLSSESEILIAGGNDFEAIEINGGFAKIDQYKINIFIDKSY
jgi:F-type H+-transporting ATPase subunit epsilon